MDPSNAAKMSLEVNTTVLKEPRGFMRVLQFIFAIFAFATTSGFTNTCTFEIDACVENRTDPITQSYKYAYPFRLSSIYVINCEDSSWRLIGDFSSQSQYFVASGVLAFLYCIASLGLYVCYDRLYRGNVMVPMIDFGLTVILAVFWLTSSAAWSQGVADLKYFSNPKHFPCIKEKCWDFKELEMGSFATLNVSLILGYLNFALWAANLWFLFKETPWFLSRTDKPPDMQ